MKRAAVAMVAILASFGIMYAICVRIGVDASPAVLAAALAVGLARRPEKVEPREVLEKLITLPLVGLAAGGIGLAFRTFAPLGAALFTIGVTISVWLRNFGERGSIVGRTIALPFIAMLVVPVHIEGHLGLGAALVLLAGVVAFVCTLAVQWLG
jgi:hypothetical protein